MLDPGYFILVREFPEKMFKIHTDIKRVLLKNDPLDDDIIYQVFGRSCPQYRAYCEVHGNGNGDAGFMVGIWLAVAETSAPYRLDEIFKAGLEV